MFKFFTSKHWFKWSILGSVFILISTWYQVQLDVKINEWFGEFYDTLQKALTTPGSVTETEFIGLFIYFCKNCRSLDFNRCDYWIFYKSLGFQMENCNG